jgi:hypothetical protein
MEPGTVANVAVKNLETAKKFYETRQPEAGP